MNDNFVKPSSHWQVLTYPVPSSATLAWVAGSNLGLFMVLQVGTGALLAMMYSGGAEHFQQVILLESDVAGGWLLRALHTNGASLLFVLLYFHVGRGLYYKSPNLSLVWSVGVGILLVMMMVAFLGYVLPWGQMSFWGVTVITNLLSAVPYFGDALVVWVWGGFSVGGSTLSRFTTLHYSLPFVILGLSAVHLWFLHESGSSEPVGLSSGHDKAPFHPYFSYKDASSMTFVLLGFTLLVLSAPWVLGDPENFLSADPLTTPVHIMPEWYFLFAYAILRSIPNKLGGVVALMASVIVLALLPLKSQNKGFIGPVHKMNFWLWVCVWALLTWLGGQGVSDCSVQMSWVASVMYFTLLL